MSELLTHLLHYAPSYQARQIAGDYPDAAVVVGITESDNPSVLLTRRAPHLNLHPGEVAFPGGKQDPEDLSLLHTALREMEEETGIAQQCFRPLAVLDQRITRTDIRMTPYLGLLPAEVRPHINRDELDSAFFVPLEQLINGNIFSVVDVEDRGQTWRVARFQFQQYDIWGATAMILADFLNRIMAAELPLEAEVRK